MRFIFILFCLSGNIWANECPSINGSFKCLMGESLLEFRTETKNGVSTYYGDVFDVEKIVADGKQRVRGKIYDFQNDTPYVATCKENKLIIVDKYFDDDMNPPEEFGGRQVFSFDGKTLIVNQWGWGPYKQRLPKEVNWEKDTEGRRVERDNNVVCVKL